MDQQKYQLELIKEQREGHWTEMQAQESAVRQWQMQKQVVQKDVTLATVHQKMLSEQAIKAGHLNLEVEKAKTDGFSAAADAAHKATKVTTDAILGHKGLQQDQQQSQQNQQLKQQELNQNQQQIDQAAQQAQQSESEGNNGAI
jgi:hypothetical protein